MNKKVVFNTRATIHTESDLISILRILLHVSNSNEIFNVSELVDTHTRKVIKRKESIARFLRSTQPKPFMFISCLN